MLNEYAISKSIQFEQFFVKKDKNYTVDKAVDQKIIHPCKDSYLKNRLIIFID